MSQLASTPPSQALNLPPPPDLESKGEVIEHTIEAFRRAKGERQVSDSILTTPISAAFLKLIHLTELLGSPWLAQLLESQAAKKMYVLDTAVAWHKSRDADKDLLTIQDVIDAEDAPTGSPKGVFRASPPRATPIVVWMTRVCMLVRDILVALGDDRERSVAAAATSAYEGKPLWASHSKVLHYVTVHF